MWLQGRGHVTTRWSSPGHTPSVSSSEHLLGVSLPSRDVKLGEGGARGVAWLVTVAG